MLVRNVKENQLRDAIDKTNKEFEGNVRLLDIRRANSKGTHWRLRLGVWNNRGRGAKLSIRYDLDGKEYVRHLSYACWHVYGTFMDNLPEGTSILISGRTKHPGEHWDDWNIGSLMFPVYFSESCEC
jgi:hypothetical protein